MTVIKNIANIITGTRIVFACLIVLVQPMSSWFFILYVSCGISDMLDGCIARKMKMESRSGAVLDSIADIIFLFTVAIRIIPVLDIPQWILWWIGLIAIVRIGAYMIGFIKYRAFVSLHTYSNKLTGLLLFCSPIIYLVIGIEATGIILIFIAMVSALEELIITMTSKEIDRNIKSILRFANSIR